MVAPDPELQAAMPGMDDMHSLRMPLCCSTLSPEMDASKGAGKPVEKSRSEKCTEVGPGKIRIGPKRVLVGATFSVEHRLRSFVNHNRTKELLQLWVGEDLFDAGAGNLTVNLHVCYYVEKR